MIPTRLLRRPRVLIVGCGDVGIRTIPSLARRFKLFALSRRPKEGEGAQRLRDAGALPIAGDLDIRPGLGRVAALMTGAFGILHFAPPASDQAVDRRMRALLASIGAGRRPPKRPNAQTRGRSTLFDKRALSNNFAGIVTDARRQAPQSAQLRHAAPWTARVSRRISRHDTVLGIAANTQRRPRLVYASTTGVYGDCAGATIDETRPARPANARAIRRVSAENMLRAAGVRSVVTPSILRIPGIYAANRLPDARLRRGTPALRPEDDVFTNHIHADDLAAIAVRALWRGRPQRIYHASDNSRMKMGDYFERVADALDLPHPPRVSRAEAERLLEPMMLSFMRESRQLDNRRLSVELRYRLRYPSVDTFLATISSRAD